MAFSLLATFVTADFILNINSILFMLECATVGSRFYSESSWLESVSFQFNDTLAGQLRRTFYISKAIRLPLGCQNFEAFFTLWSYQVIWFWRSEVVKYWEFHLVYTNRNSYSFWEIMDINIHCMIIMNDLWKQFLVVGFLIQEAN